MIRIEDTKPIYDISNNINDIFFRVFFSLVSQFAPSKINLYEYIVNAIFFLQTHGIISPILSHPSFIYLIRCVILPPPTIPPISHLQNNNNPISLGISCERIYVFKQQSLKSIYLMWCFRKEVVGGVGNDELGIGTGSFVRFDYYHYYYLFVLYTIHY